MPDVTLRVPLSSSSHAVMARDWDCKLAALCEGSYQPLRPLLAELMLRDLCYMGEETFVDLGTEKYKPLLRRFYDIKRKPPPGWTLQDSIFDDACWQVIDFSSHIIPKSAVTGGEAYSSSDIERMLQQLAAEKLVKRMPTCLNLSKCHLQDDDVAGIIKALEILSRLISGQPIALVMRFTRLGGAVPLSSSAGADTPAPLLQLLQVRNLRWLDVCQTAVASMDSTKVLAKLTADQADRLVLVSNPYVLERALRVLYEANEALVERSTRAHGLYHALKPPLAERTTFTIEMREASQRLEDAAEQAAAYLAKETEASEKVKLMEAGVAGLAGAVAGVVVGCFLALVVVNKTLHFN